MPSDVTINKGDSTLHVTRRAFERIYKDRGYKAEDTTTKASGSTSTAKKEA